MDTGAFNASCTTNCNLPSSSQMLTMGIDILSWIEAMMTSVRPRQSGLDAEHGCIAQNLRGTEIRGSRVPMAGPQHSTEQGPL